MRISTGTSIFRAHFAIHSKIFPFYMCKPGLATTSFFFCFLFVKNPGGQINDPSPGNTVLFRSSQQLPRLASSVASGTTEIQGHSQVCHTRCTAIDANLDSAFVKKNELVFVVPIIALWPPLTTPLVTTVQSLTRLSRRHRCL